MAAHKTSLASKQKQLDQVRAERVTMEKLEAEAKNASKNKDRRIEESCRQWVFLWYFSSVAC